MKLAPLYRSSAESSNTPFLLDKPVLKVNVNMKSLCIGADFIHSVTVDLGKFCWWELAIFALTSKAVEEIYFSDANDLEVHSYMRTGCRQTILCHCNFTDRGRDNPVL